MLKFYFVFGKIVFYMKTKTKHYFNFSYPCESLPWTQFPFNLSILTSPLFLTKILIQNLRKTCRVRWKKLELVLIKKYGSVIFYEESIYEISKPYLKF